MHHDKGHDYCEMQMFRNTSPTSFGIIRHRYWLFWLPTRNSKIFFEKTPYLFAGA